MFGCIVAGRLLQTNLQQIDDTHAYFELPAASSINHICLFLLGTVPFPDGYGATVHFFWPGKGFQLLGMLSNDKPSAIFRLRGTFTPNASSSFQSTFSNTPTALTPNPNPNSTSDVTAVLGLSIEPLSQIQSQLSSLPSSTSTSITKPSPSILTDPTLLAERIIKHLFNYISSFIAGGANLTPETAVPMNIIAKWYDNFSRKIKTGGTAFLERDE